MTAYYNEIDPYAAQWLRNLIAAGHIAPGEVDERSIEDVTPNDLRGFTQCHFFAGIGVWSHALRLAGWPDDEPVWTGSCPCQPFSAAGKGNGFDDERHLWPAFYHLIEQCRPAIVFGEQVASKDAEPWLDLVQDDLEALGYAVGAVPFPFPAAGIGAPHIRDRLYWVGWVGDDDGPRSLSGAFGGVHCSEESAGARHGESERYGATRRVADLHSKRRGEARSGELSHGSSKRVECGNHSGGLADDTISGRREERADARRRVVRDRAQGFAAGLGAGSGDLWAGPLHGFWRDADWLLCRDGKWRPVEPGTFPLAHGAPARVGRLRAYGNAIVATQAAHFISAVMECRP